MYNSYSKLYNNHDFDLVAMHKLDASASDSGYTLKNLYKDENI